MRSVLVLLLALTASAIAQETRASKLAAASAKVLRRDSTLALLLAREALVAADTEPARTALYDALIRTRERAIFRHDAPVACVDLAPDGLTVATGTEDGTACLWTAASVRLAEIDAGEPVTAIRFLGDGDHVLTVTKQHLAFWDRTGTRLASFPAARHVATGDGVLVFAAADQVRFLGPDGSLVAGTEAVHADVGVGPVAFYAVKPDGQVWLFDARGRHTVLRADEGTKRAVFTRDGEVGATFGGGPRVTLWTNKGRRLAILAHTGAIEAVSLNAKKRRVLTASADGSYRFWDFDGKQLCRRTRLGPARSVEIAEDGYWSVALEGDRRIIVWAGDGDEFETAKGTLPIRRIVPNYRGMGFAIEYENDTRSFTLVDLRDARPKNLLRGKLTLYRWAGDWLLVADDTGRAALQHWYGAGPVFFDGHTSAVVDACLSTDDRFVLTGSRDKTARLWEIEPTDMPVLHHEGRLTGHWSDPKRKRMVTMTGNVLYFRDAELHTLAEVKLPQLISWSGLAGDRFALTCTGGTSAWLYDLDGKVVAELRHTVPVRGVTLSSKGDRILTFSGEETIARLWSKRGKPQKQLKHPRGVLEAEFLPDGRSILTVDASAQARIWSTSGKVRAEWNVTDRIFYCEVAESGDRILSVPESSPIVRIWDSKGEPLGTLEGHTRRVWCAGIDSESGTILTASADNTARLWNASGSEKCVLPHPDEVLSCRFLPHGRGCITTCKDGAARDWGPDGHLRATIRGHVREVWRFSIEKDGKWLATASMDTTLRFWPMTGEQLLSIAANRLCRDFAPKERAKYAALLAK
jgi:WD40 repeat protein